MKQRIYILAAICIAVVWTSCGSNDGDRILGEKYDGYDTYLRDTKWLGLIDMEEKGLCDSIFIHFVNPSYLEWSWHQKKEGGKYVDMRANDNTYRYMIIRDEYGGNKQVDFKLYYKDMGTKISHGSGQGVDNREFNDADGMWFFELASEIDEINIYSMVESQKEMRLRKILK